jgi:maltooligosyltrehalose trehalohydrolase
VQDGRKKFLTQFPTVAMPDVQANIPDPDDRKTFTKCKLNHNERNPQFVALHRDLIWLRRSDDVFRSPRPRGVDGAIIGDNAFVLRFFGEENGDRLLVINFGQQLAEGEPQAVMANAEVRRVYMGMEA